MKEQWQQFMNRYGVAGLIRFALHPVSLLLGTPWRLIEALGNAATLFNGRWSDFSHFNSHTAFNSLFYWTRALNLKRFGRGGRSPYLGLGNYNLSRCFHYALFSLFAYWRAGAVTVLVSMVAWLYMNLLWGLETDASWAGLIVLLAFISPMWYSNTFRFQNYNAVSWIFFPAFLFGMHTGNPYIMAAALLGQSFGGITVVFISGLLFGWYLLRNLAFLDVWIVLPALLKLSLHFTPFLKNGAFGEVMQSVMKAIGVTQKATRYKRKTKGRKLTLQELYHLALPLQFAVVVWLVDGVIPELILVGTGIFMLNYLFMRFADDQSIYMLFFSLTTMTAMLHPDPVVLVSYWVAIAPLPLLTGWDIYPGTLDVVPAVAPFDIGPAKAKMHQFLAPVAKDQRVFMAFDDPGNVYEQIFDGWRQLIELPSYVANEREILFMPEWWGVFELNYEGAPEIWGRKPEQLRANMQHWEAAYGIVYQTEGGPLDAKWAENGFEHLNTFDWSELKDDFKGHKRYDSLDLCFYLVRDSQNG